jgi:SAM-dependent methyltransferase
MNWSQAREELRDRLIAKYNETEAKWYDDFVGTLSDDDEEAYLADILDAVPLSAGQNVLDVGAGSGTISKLVSRVDGLTISALEPSPAMCDLMRRKPQLANVTIIAGGCDRRSDHTRVAPGSVDVIISRQVVNSLFDPLVAFQNWLHWLKQGGKAIVIDGIYGRDGWQGIWAEEVDALPLSACQSLATIPYLLQSVGFEVESAGWMTRANQLPSTRTKRYMVVATKPTS